MDTSVAISLGVVITLQIISLLLSALLVYCSLKVQPINKPPGSLVLVEIIFISLIQLLRAASTIAWQLSESQSYSIKAAVMIPIQAIALYCTFTNFHYEICIIFELYLRLKVRKNTQPFRKRAIIYHAVSHSIALCVIIIEVVAYITLNEESDDEYVMYDYTKWMFWFMISYMIVNLIIFSTFAVMTGYKNSKLLDSSVKRFIDKLIKYMIVLVIVRAISIIIDALEAVIIGNLDSENAKILAINCTTMVATIMNIILYIMRMFDPYIKEFLKCKLKAMKYRMKDKMNDMIGRRRLVSTMTINQNFIPVRKLFDDILIEKIEYQLIALSIAMLKEQDDSESIE